MEIQIQRFRLRSITSKTKTKVPRAIIRPSEFLGKNTPLPGTTGRKADAGKKHSNQEARNRNGSQASGNEIELLAWFKTHGNVEAYNSRAQAAQSNGQR